MGTDIYGWVEIKNPNSQTWMGVMSIEYVAERNYRLFSVLFGGRYRVSGFTPIAADRGIPDDLSPEAREFWDDGHDATWILWSELNEVDWDDTLDMWLKATWDRMAGPIVSPGWQAILQEMAQLADRVAGDQIRLVVWFDQPHHV